MSCALEEAFKMEQGFGVEEEDEDEECFECFECNKTASEASNFEARSRDCVNGTVIFIEMKLRVIPAYTESKGRPASSDINDSMLETTRLLRADCLFCSFF